MFYFFSAVLALLVTGLWYLTDLFLRKRNELKGFPQPPMKNKLLGHLHIAEECTRLFPPNCHPQCWPRYIQKKYQMGEYFYVDWWPLGPRWLYISDPELITSSITGPPQSLPKSGLFTSFLRNFLGEHNMVGIEGQHWKSLRTMFNPGFSASHLMTLVPYIVDASLVFHDVLAKSSQSGQLVELEELATRLTIDIIGKVVLDSDFNSQQGTHPIVECFRRRIALMPVQLGAIDLTKFELRRRWKLRQNGQELDRLIGYELDRKMSGSAFPSSQKKRSVVDLALATHKNEQLPLGKDGNKSADDNFRTVTIDSIKTFIFAGHDTSASTIAYVFYLLHFHPEVHGKIVAELNSVFGDIKRDSMAKSIKETPYLINRLEYLTAAIKEALRLFPPVSTIRATPADSGISVIDPKTGTKLPTSGVEIWPPPILVGRNEKFFPEPTKFVPERFIPSMTPYPEAKLFTQAGKDAWRAFETGPRRCIGEALAMIELKVSLMLTLPDFDFVAEFEGKKDEKWMPMETWEELQDGVSGNIRHTVEGHAAYQILKGAAKPRGGMSGRLSLR